MSQLEEFIQEKDIEIKKLEYHNKVLDAENNEMSQKIEELQKRCAEIEEKYCEECSEIDDRDEKVKKLVRLNELYLSEIENCKKEINLLLS